MLQELLPYAGFLMAGIMTFWAYLSWRKTVNLQNFAIEANHHIEVCRTKIKQLELQNQTLNQECEEFSEKKQYLEQQLYEQQEKLDLLTKQLKTQDETLESEKNKRTLRIEHLNEQVTALTNQLSQTDKEKAEVKSKYESLQKNFQEELALAKESLERKIREWRKKYQDMEHEKALVQASLDKLKQSTLSIDAVELKKLKRRLAHWENLYNSMRGLKEMADERNQNWEVALRKLASSIIKQKNPEKNLNDITIGPLVGEALETIGEKLIIEDHPEPSDEINFENSDSASSQNQPPVAENL